MYKTYFQYLIVVLHTNRLYKLSRTRKIANRSEINQGNIRDKVELQYSVDTIFVESFFTTIPYLYADLWHTSIET